MLPLLCIWLGNRLYLYKKNFYVPFQTSSLVLAYNWVATEKCFVLSRGIRHQGVAAVDLPVCFRYLCYLLSEAKLTPLRRPYAGVMFSGVMF